MLRVKPVLSRPSCPCKARLPLRLVWEVPGSRTAAFRPQADGRAHLGLTALAMKTPTFPAELRWAPCHHRHSLQGGRGGDLFKGLCLVLPQDPGPDPNAF